ncbi:alpha-keto acid decarboxylase family protein [Pyxidicoccus fallax]|uniref:Alpha-keto acid decarboxylase family protein n=1 Tax=Pyxidicoccus fallax TaxID=394095 RepID=A0A848L6W7_9BACT|nr:thiamine pyrophosphate-binding protein [Pyxidicoccus fallax]NMO14267.1 alpha-keto acid decarboxylase family protein [Pyxidicoccus fallax]NPC82605.1 alpha-keto acid decarboxylase family protein [Pyxidicoccus fallax]
MKWTVAQYLKTRLEQLGLDRLFGVAGNYTAPFLNTILADKKSPIVITHNANELCAGYAADAYARLKGIGALHVTYSVGAFSLLNAIAGSYTEQVPVLLINGAPTNKEDSVEKNAGLLYSHTTGAPAVDIDVFRPVTVGAERVSDARRAPYQIDSVLTAMLTQRRPVYLEFAEDVWRAACQAPVGELRSGLGTTIAVSEATQAVAAAMQLIQSKTKCIFWAGIELQRFGLTQPFLSLLDTVNRLHAFEGQGIGFVTSPLSKSVVSEDHAYFQGCVTLTQTEIQQLVGDDGCLIGLGAWTTGKDTGNQNIRSSSTILASHGGVWVGASFFPLVGLEAFIQGLEKAFIAWAEQSAGKHLAGLRVRPAVSSKAALKAPRLTYDAFFASLGGWLTAKEVVVVDAGFPLVGAQSLHIPAQDGFVAQAAWLAIGYSVGAGTGVSCARPDKRAIVIVGDGAFHETCQAVSDHHANGLNTVVFVLANGLYGIEQQIVNPNPFRSPVVEYKDPLLDTFYPYNVLPRWKYDRIAEVFGGVGRKAASVDELEGVLREIRDTPGQNFVVEITIPEADSPAAIRAGLETTVGEDEIENPGWPPPSIF